MKKVALFYLLIFLFLQIVHSVRKNQGKQQEPSKTSLTTVTFSKDLRIPINIQRKLIEFYFSVKMNKKGRNELSEFKRKMKNNKIKPKLTENLKEAIKFLLDHQILPRIFSKYFKISFSQIGNIVGQKFENDYKKLWRSGMKEEDLWELKRLMKRDFLIAKGKRIADGQYSEEEEEFIERGKEIQQKFNLYSEIAEFRISREQQNELVAFYFWLNPEASRIVEERKNKKKPTEKGRFVADPLNEDMKNIVKFLSVHNITFRNLSVILHTNKESIKKTNEIPDQKKLYYLCAKYRKLTEMEMERQMAKIKEDFEGNELGKHFNEIYIKIREIRSTEKMVVDTEFQKEQNHFYRFKVALFMNLKDEEGNLESHLFQTWSEHYDIAVIKIPIEIFRQISDGEEMWMDVIGREGEKIHFESIEFEFEHGTVFEFEFNDGTPKITKKPFSYDLLRPRHQLRFFVNKIGPRQRLLEFLCGDMHLTKQWLEFEKFHMNNKFYSWGRVNYEGNVCAGDKYHFEIGSGAGNPSIQSVICPQTPEDGEFLVKYRIEPDINNIFYCTLEKATSLLETDEALSEWQE